ncbi:MAG: biotin synthase BioB [Bacteroidales bacterium]|nr:biotin synthase BioB [Bacteroidales bacterium]
MLETTRLNIPEAARKSLEGEALQREEALQVLDLPRERLPELLEAVYTVRRTYKGNRVGIQILTNARSGDCTQNCAYCAQSRDAKSSPGAYRLVPLRKLLDDGSLAQRKGLSRHCIGLSGIRFSDREIDEFADHVRRLKQTSNAHICCSIGFLTPQQARKLKEAGVNRINHNLNTSRRFYPEICTTHTYLQRLENIRMLQEEGFEICCGGIVGLGESREDVADMFFDIRAIRPQSVPVNFLIPVGGTALEKADVSPLTPEYCLKVLSLARLMIPQADIRCAAGREIYLKGREKEMFHAVDSIFASGYLTVGGQSVEDAIRMVAEAGFESNVEY